MSPIRTDPSAARRAFTLVEILVVMGVIAALLGVLLPSIGRAMAASRQVRCASNLHQWTSAAIAHATSHQGYLPRRGQGVQVTSVLNRKEDWFNALPPLMGMESYMSLAARNAIPRAEDQKIWACPEARDTNTTNFFSYGMNMRLSTWLTPTPDRIGQVAPPELQVFMTDGPAGYCSLLPSRDVYSPIARHNGRVAISFLDGHVELFPGTDVGCGIGDPFRPDVQWVVPGSPWGGP